MDKKTFEIIILNGRPAAGKSEVIDYLKKIPVEERIKRFHVGEFLEIDDFPFLWEDFEDDDLREEMGLPRLISSKTFEYQVNNPTTTIGIRIITNISAPLKLDSPLATRTV